MDGNRSATKRSWTNISCNNLIVFIIASSCIPAGVNNLFIVLFFKYSIASKDNEVIIFSNLKTFDIRCTNYTFWIASISWVFSLNVTNCSGDRQPTWKDTVWTYDRLQPWGIVRWWIWNLAFILIYLSSIFLNSLCFNFIFRFVIFRQQKYLFPAINWHYSSAVPNIGNITHVFNNK